MKKIQFFDYPKLWKDERDELIKIIDSTASSGGYIMQEDLFLFEEELADYIDIDYALGVGNATDAMEIFLEAIGLREGDEIIISSHTMLATASSIVMSGGIPVPVDIGSDNLIDPKSIEEAINSKTVGIMPTQLNGRTCNMDEISKIAKKNNLFIVEDSAQSLGSKFKDKSAGTFGLASCISFFPAKVMGCFGDAGAIIVNDEDLYNKCYQIRDHGRDKDGDVVRWGRNSRLDNLQAAILRYKLNNYHTVVERRREIASLYEEHLNDLEELILPPAPDSDKDHFDVFQNYELAANDRDGLKDYLDKNGIGTLIQWGGMAIHHYKNLGFKQVLPNTDRFFNHCIMLPMNIFITNEEVEYICDITRKFYRG